MTNIVLSVLGRDSTGEATKSAIGNLDALTAKRDQASRALSAMSARDADAAGRMRVAVAALADAQSKYTDGSVQVVRAEERLQTAQRASTIIQNDLQAASARLGSAEQRLADETASTATRVEESSSRMRGALDAMSGATDRLGSHLGNLLGGALSGVAAAGAFAVWQTGVQVFDDLAQAAGNAAKAAIDFDSQLESANIGFTTMLGSGQKATGMLADLQKFALVTPFRFGDLTQYAQQMLGYGISAKQIIPDLKALGDASAASGRTDQLGNVVLAFEQMSARGRVDLQDINQLTQGGVPALKILAAQYHTTTGGMLDMISTGKLMASDALPKLTAGIEHGTKSTAALGGMMTKQSQTFAGAMSNIQDALQQAGGKAFQPFFKMLERGAGDVATFLSSKSFGTWVSDTAKALTGFVKDVSKGFQDIVKDPNVQAAMGRLGKDFPDNVKKIGPAVEKILPKLVDFGKTELPVIIDAIDKIVKNTPKMLDGLNKFADTLKDLEPVFSGFISGSADVVNFFLNLPGYASDAFKGLESFGYNLAGWWNDDFIGPAKNALTWFLGLPGQFADIGMHLIDGLIGGIRKEVTDVTGTIHDVASNLVGTFKNVLGIQSPSKVFHQLGVWISQGLANGINAGSASAVTSAMDDLVSKVQSGYQSLAAASNKAWGQRKTDEATIGKDDTRAKDLARQKDLAEDALHSAKTEKQRKSAQARIAKIDEEIAANRKNRAATVQDLDGAIGEIRADGTTKQREAREAAILKQISGVNGQLDKLATEREKVAANLATATDSLNSAKQQRSDFAAGIVSSVQALGALTGATSTQTSTTDWTGAAGTTGPASAGDMIAHLQAALAATSQAGTVFAQLKNLGLNTQSYRELESAFQSNGDLSNATSLLQGGAAAIGQVNTLEGQLTAAGTSFGNDASGTLYDQGVNAAQGIVDGLQSADDKLTDQMTKLGTALADAVNKELSAKFTGAKNGGVNVGAINVTSGGMTTDQLIASLDWAARTST